MSSLSSKPPEAGSPNTPPPSGHPILKNVAKHALIITSIALEIIGGSLALTIAIPYALPIAIGCYSLALLTSLYNYPLITAIGLEVLAGSLALYLALPYAIYTAAGFFSAAAVTVIIASVAKWRQHNCTNTPTSDTPKSTAGTSKSSDSASASVDPKESPHAAKTPSKPSAPAPATVEASSLGDFVTPLSDAQKTFIQTSLTTIATAGYATLLGQRKAITKREKEIGIANPLKALAFYFLDEVSKGHIQTILDFRRWPNTQIKNEFLKTQVERWKEALRGVTYTQLKVHLAAFAKDTNIPLNVVENWFKPLFKDETFNDNLTNDTVASLLRSVVTYTVPAGTPARSSAPSSTPTPASEPSSATAARQQNASGATTAAIPTSFNPASAAPTPVPATQPPLAAATPSAQAGPSAAATTPYSSQAGPSAPDQSEEAQKLERLKSIMGEHTFGDVADLLNFNNQHYDEQKKWTTADKWTAERIKQSPEKVLEQLRLLGIADVPSFHAKLSERLLTLIGRDAAATLLNWHGKKYEGSKWTAERITQQSAGEAVDQLKQLGITNMEQFQAKLLELLHAITTGHTYEDVAKLLNFYKRYYSTGPWTALIITTNLQYLAGILLVQLESLGVTNAQSFEQKITSIALLQKYPLNIAQLLSAHRYSCKIYGEMESWIPVLAITPGQRVLDYPDQALAQLQNLSITDEATFRAEYHKTFPNA